ncbi:DUF6020 family protein [Bifidobacterium mongoliense]|uniref:DUF6020 family protein n=1 Tax=Bifidobacterium mongoliense TaxID=518643 RepID=UPI0030EBE3EC
MHVLTVVRDRWLLLAITLICGILCAIVDSIKQTDGIVVSSGYLLRALLYMVVFTIMVLLGERFLVWLHTDARAQLDTGKKAWALSFGAGSRTYIILIGIILVCWLPYIVLAYPGVIWYDTQQQLLQWFGFPNTFTDGTFLSDHHPVLDTAIFGGFVQLGELFGSRDIGPFLYSIVQAVVTASSLASVVRYSHTIGLSRRFCMFTLLFFALFPVIPLYAVGMVKDAVSLPFFVWFMISFVEVVRSKGVSLHNKKSVIVLIVTALAMALTKKTGIYVVVLSCVAGLCFLPRGYRARLALCAAIPAAVMVFLLPLILFPVLHIEKGGKQEMLAVPFQQSALLVKKHETNMSRTDLEGIYAILGTDVASRYQWWAADNVKGYTWDSSKDQYLPQYFAIWLKNGIEHPRTYLQAYLAMEEGWISMPNAFDARPDLALMPVYVVGNNHVFTHSRELGFSDSGDLERSKKLEQFINWFEGSAFGSVFFSRALWSSGICVFVVYESLRRNKRRISWIMPYLVTYMLLWVSPASVTIEGMRYVIPLVIAAPLACGALLAPDVDSAGLVISTQDEEL